mgnify:CR=1 FL=1
MGWTEERVELLKKLWLEGLSASQIAGVLGEGVTRSCAFYLQGKPEALTTWLDAAHPGSLAPSSDGVTLTVEEGRQHPGCLNVLMPEIATGLDLTQTASKKWIGLVTVSADKAYLLKTPGAKAAKRPYIVKRDVVGVLAFKDGWAQVEFINAEVTGPISMRSVLIGHA